MALSSQCLRNQKLERYSGHFPLSSLSWSPPLSARNPLTTLGRCLSTPAPLLFTPSSRPVFSSNCYKYVTHSSMARHPQITTPIGDVQRQIPIRPSKQSKILTRPIYPCSSLLWPPLAFSLSSSFPVLGICVFSLFCLFFLHSRFLSSLCQVFKQMVPCACGDNLYPLP